jgi:hypothetical protein
VLARLNRITDRAERDRTATFNNLYQYYNVNDNWRWVLKYREAARRMGLRWVRRRSQNSQTSWSSYQNYLQHHPLPNPSRIVDLIANARQARNNAGLKSQIVWLFD